MATVTIYHQGDNRSYTVSINLFTSVLDMVNGTASNANIDFYLKLTTTIKKLDGTAYPDFVIRTLADVPPTLAGFPAWTNPATSFTELVNQYVDYFLNYSEFGQSSSSSSNSSSSSSSNSSSSSSSHSVSSSSSSSSNSQ